MLPLEFLRKMILEAFETGFAVIISGYSNDLGVNRTYELRESLAKTFCFANPVIFPAKGFWHGVEETSLVMILAEPFTRHSDQIVATERVRTLLKEYDQYAALVVFGGEFYNINNRDKTTDPDSVIGNGVNEKLTGGEEGWTEVYLHTNIQGRAGGDLITQFTVINKVTDPNLVTDED